MAKAKKVLKRAKRPLKSKKAAARSKVAKTTIKKAKPVKGELKKYRELLIGERERMTGALSHIAENTLKKSQRDASGNLSGYSYHMADQATDDYDVEFSLGRATEDQELLFKIDEALKRVEDGSYGKCLQCGKPIAKPRLKALPYAEVCIVCQRANDTAR